MREYIGHNDKKGRKLYVGDRVVAPNGVKGTIVSFDYLEQERDGTINSTKKYRVNWSPDGMINDVFTEHNVFDGLIVKCKERNTNE